MFIVIERLHRAILFCLFPFCLRRFSLQVYNLSIHTFVIILPVLET